MKRKGLSFMAAIFMGSSVFAQTSNMGGDYVITQNNCPSLASEFGPRAIFHVEANASTFAISTLTENGLDVITKYVVGQQPVVGIGTQGCVDSEYSSNGSQFLVTAKNSLCVVNSPKTILFQAAKLNQGLVLELHMPVAEGTCFLNQK